ncbi:acyltransferase [Rugamonas sp. FT82W]|uniref:Acyltransferase n=1 Tax=Duganella vulcania TaxID=2692166 RepID=A0A845G9H8_9BURK|nr:acyltransferase [Duganella vulcania]MYM90541.1 acyltransferase [Duganella vulcania]
MKQVLKRVIKKSLKATIGWPKDKPDPIEHFRRNGMKVGANFHMLEGCIIDDSHYWLIDIGDNVTLAPRVHLLAHDASTKMHLNYTKIKNVSIGNKVFIGAGSIVMPGVRIGDNVIIGAGSVVTRDVQPNSVYAGNPAKFICGMDDYLAKEKARMTADNTFGEEYTLRQAVGADKKAHMQRVLAKDGVGFVI